MFLQKFSLPLFISVLLIFWSSCDLKVQIPSYIRVNSINVTTKGQYAIYGSSSSDITDAWVYVDDQPIGAFELPATIPILNWGVHSVMIKAGIKVDGISALRSVYPFYQPYTANMNLVAGIKNAINVNPTLTYSSNTMVQWKEDFEQSVSIDSVNFSDTTMTQTPQNLNPCTYPACPCSGDTEVYEGHYSGLISLDASHTFFEGEENITSSYFLPNGTNPSFLEMNYKANQSFVVGIAAINGSNVQIQDILTINPTNKWNKIYINLNTAINNNTIDATSFKIYFKITKSSTVALPQVLLDNIKVIYQQQ
jgi:hypothetical protein